MTLYRGPHSLFRALAPKYRLNKAEYLQLYNLRPTTQVMLELVIEEVRWHLLPSFHISRPRCPYYTPYTSWQDALSLVSFAVAMRGWRKLMFLLGGFAVHGG